MESTSDMRNDEVAAPAGEARRLTSLDKALEVCETLATAPRGMPLSDLAKALGLPASTAHRLLAVLKRRGYVRQDEETGRYGLTMKMLDLSFKWLGRSEVRLHAYPLVREFVLRTGARAFIAVAATGEVTYVWTAGPDEVAMHTVYGREMPGHCSVYVAQPAPETRRLSCLKLQQPLDDVRAEQSVLRVGAFGGAVAASRLNCTCAPVFDYTGREVARVGLFSHGPDDRGLCADTQRHAWELARLVSLRLGHLPVTSLAVTA
jgi:IclR family transcriptional regulator, KDG regulon repressor